MFHLGIQNIRMGSEKLTVIYYHKLLPPCPTILSATFLILTVYFIYVPSHNVSFLFYLTQCPQCSPKLWKIPEIPSFVKM